MRLFPVKVKTLIYFIQLIKTSPWHCCEIPELLGAAAVCSLLVYNRPI